MSKNENCNTCTIQTGKLILNQFHETLRTTIITAPCFQQRLAILAGFLTTNTQCFCGSDIIQSIESVEANALNAVLLIVIDQIINNLNKAAVICLFVILGIPFKSFFYLQIIKCMEAGFSAAGNQKPLGRITPCFDNKIAPPCCFSEFSRGKNQVRCLITAKITFDSVHLKCH